MSAHHDDRRELDAGAVASLVARTTRDDVLDWIQREITAHSGGPALLICGGPTDERLLGRLPANVLLWRHARGAGGTLGALFADAVFSRIYTHSALAPVGDEPFIADLHRVLRADGTLLASACSKDFAFAPLPAGGDAQALRRVLQLAGFTGIYLEQRGNTSFVMSARRRARR